ncbi:MAG: hypothetical protein KJO82_12130, partial [Gammaproteobacteria bacterium]|nr:hypothetical protein [Gammaproteobacteria bacterium]
YSAAPDGSTVLKLSGTLVTTGDVRGKPSWSPLSDWLVYLALQGPGLLELHAASADGASNVKIDGTMGAFIVPGEGIELWSPLGGQLMYIYDQAADGIFDIHVWDTTSQMSTRISQAQVTGDNLPDHGIWSDDGSRIAYVFEPAGAPASLFLASADGLVNQEITDTLLNNRPVSERFFNWSPGVEMRSDEAAFSPP